MTFAAIMKADFLQRLRGPKFGLVLLGFAFFAFLAFPGVNAGYSTIDIYGYRGLYNSAWMGDTLAIITSMFLPLVGFYLIKSAIALDRKTTVDVLLKSSPLKRHNYILGKWLSNVLLLLSLVLLMNMVAILKQFYLGESYTIDLIALLAHQAVLAFPFVLITSSLALLFESLPVLRGGIGNMIYVFLWTPMLIIQMEGGFGAAAIVDRMEASIDEADRLKDGFVIGDEIIETPLATFEWTGFALDSAMWLSALYATSFALALLIINFLVFRHRFEGVNLGRLIKKNSKKPIPAAIPSATTLTPLGAFKSR
ncbi:MAG: ABC-2 transporter permease, partial [Alphaproteobacteria bacterium]